MSEWISELARRLIVSRKRDGRCVYDAQAKQELIEACGRPGISMAKLARGCGITANLLNTWVRKHERKAVALSMPAAAEADAAAPAVRNGVVVDLAGCELSQACAFVEALGRLRCSASIRN